MLNLLSLFGLKVYTFAAFEPVSCHALLCPAISCPAVSCRVIWSVIFTSSIFSAPRNITREENSISRPRSFASSDLYIFHATSWFDRTVWSGPLLTKPVGGTGTSVLAQNLLRLLFHVGERLISWRGDKKTAFSCISLRMNYRLYHVTSSRRMLRCDVSSLLEVSAAACCTSSPSSVYCCLLFCCCV